MFDIGFTELTLVALVALVVIGPERLPTVARTLGHLFGRLQRYVSDVKSDISREIELDELRKFKNQFEDAAESVKQSVRGEMADVETAYGELASEFEEPDPASEPAPATGGASGDPSADTANAGADTQTSSESAELVAAREATGRAETVTENESPAGLGQKSTA